MKNRSATIVHHCFWVILLSQLLVGASQAQSTPQLNKKFAKKVTVDVKSEGIGVFCEKLSQEHKVLIQIDVAGLADDGISLDDSISLSLKRVSLYTVLQLAADSLGLTCVPQGSGLQLTTYPVMEERLYEQQYTFPGVAQLNFDSRNFADVMQLTTTGPWAEIEQVGGEFTAFAPTAFKVMQNWRTHQEIGYVMAELQSIISGRGQLPRPLSEQLLAKSIAKSLELAPEELPLHEFLDKLLGAHALNYWIDLTELSNEGIQANGQISIAGGKRSIYEHLSGTLESLDLVPLIDGEVIKITTKIKAAELLIVRVYDVRKQVRQVGTPEGVAEIVMQTAGTGPWQKIDQAGGDVAEVGPLLVIRQTRKSHQKIADLLK